MSERPFPDPTSPKQFLQEIYVGKYLVKAYAEFGDVILKGRGFRMRFPEKPNGQPVAEVKEGQPTEKLFNDPTLLEQLSDFGHGWRVRMGESIQKDWGEKCFVPDSEGFYHHPFIMRGGKELTCLHCEKTFPGADVAANLWHCPDPECDGSPIDMG